MQQSRRRPEIHYPHLPRSPPVLVTNPPIADRKREFMVFLNEFLK